MGTTGVAVLNSTGTSEEGQTATVPAEGGGGGGGGGEEDGGEVSLERSSTAGSLPAVSDRKRPTPTSLFMRTTLQLQDPRLELTRDGRSCKLWVPYPQE